jgi:hypothetical protein
MSMTVAPVAAERVTVARVPAGLRTSLLAGNRCSLLTEPGGGATTA